MAVALWSISAVVPTLGASPLLRPCLEALRAQRPPVEIVLVDQSAGARAAGAVAGLADRVVSTAGNLGFASGTNAGIAAAGGAWIATVNDDAVVAPGWANSLLAALQARPDAGAAQGVVLRGGRADETDGAGLAWNAALQAIQLGRGEPAPPLDATPREVFGVSATAALYRRTALAAVALADGAIFDPRLGSYYEDADLACRLRAAGWRALLVPAARAEHAGSLSSRHDRLARWRQIRGNRWLVLARALGKDFRSQIPRLLARDCVDGAGRLLRLDLPGALAVVAGWARALRLRRQFAHRGEPALTVAALLASRDLGR